MDFDANKLIKEQQEAETERAAHDGLWQEVAELCLPRDAVFRGANKSPGSPRNDKMFDDYGVGALDKGVATFSALVMPRGSRWQLLEAADKELMKLQHVAAWFEQKTQRLFDLRNDSKSGFVQQCDLSVSRLIGMGNQSMWVDVRRDHRGRAVGLSYRAEPLHEITIGLNWEGNVDRTRQSFMLTPEQAVQRYGLRELERAGADKVLSHYRDDKKRHQPMEFLNVQMPNHAFDGERLDWRGKPIVGVTISLADKVVIEVGGYRAAPRTYSRFKQSPNEKYGRGRGVDALPTLRQIQQLQIDMMVGAELNGQPMLGVADDALDHGIRYGPREVIFGAIDHRGNKLVQQITEPVSLNEMGAMLSGKYQRIDQYFFVDMYMGGGEKTHMTAEYWLARREEKGILLAPLAQQENEWFSPMLDREIDCMDQLGEFDDMPGEVIEAGGERIVRYANPLARLQESEGAAGLFRTFQQLATVAAVQPQVYEELLTEFPPEKWISELARINGAPPTWRASDDERQAARAAKVQQQQVQQLMAALPALGQAANDLSGAGAQAVV